MIMVDTYSILMMMFDEIFFTAKAAKAYPESRRVGFM